MFEEKIRETFKIIPDRLFENKITEKSIYVNLESLGYIHDWSGKVFTDKDGKQIYYYEIKHGDIKRTKAETIAHLKIGFDKQKEILRKVGEELRKKL